MREPNNNRTHLLRWPVGRLLAAPVGAAEGAEGAKLTTPPFKSGSPLELSPRRALHDLKRGRSPGT